MLVMEKKLTKIENDIKIMEESNDFKVQMKKFKKNSQRITEAKDLLENINKKLELEIKDSVVINEDEYYKNIKKLEEFKQSIETNDKLENMIDIYNKSQEIINECKKYLENQKMEIENIE
jgi:exonuclease VII small subunit